jgi:hypothetical protein
MTRSRLLKVALPILVATPLLAFARTHFTLGFGNTIVSGFPTGVVFVSGGGSYDPSTASNVIGDETFVHSAGGFRCVDSVGQGPIAGCEAGEGVRWDTDQLLASTTFKCTGAAAEPLKRAATNDRIAVLLSDFYRAGDGDDASFKGVQMIISRDDLDPDIEGIQNIWIQGVGCGTAGGTFRGR